MTVTVTAYKTLTKSAFALPETAAIASLITQGVNSSEIKHKVIEEDLLQLRSRSSRQGTLQTILRRFKKLPKDYMQLLTSENMDTRRLTLLFLLLKENRLLRELISEVILENLSRLDRTLTGYDLRAFFEAKREQEPTVAQWSDSTYERTIQNTVMTLVKAGLLYPGQPKGDYEIRSMPLPSELRQQLLLDGYESYLALMLN